MPEVCDYCFTVKSWSIHRIQESHTRAAAPAVGPHPRRAGGRRCPLTAASFPSPTARCRSTQREEILLGHGSGGKLTAPADRAHVPARLSGPRPRRARRPGDRLGQRLASGVHHRLLRRHADLLPRRRHRRAGRQRHGQRPGDGRRARRSSSRSRSSSRRACRSPTCERRGGLGATRRRSAPACASSPATPRWSGRGSGDKIFINTSGIGLVPPGIDLSLAQRPARRRHPALRAPSAITAWRSSRSARGWRSTATLESDTAPLHELAAAALDSFPGVHAMRDPTRGGVAATLVEIASRQRLGIEVDETAIPMRDTVRGACEILGLDPLLVANEGKLVAFVPEDGSERVLAAHARASARAARRAASAASPPSTRGWSCCARRSAATASSICRSGKRCRASAESGEGSIACASESSDRWSPSTTPIPIWRRSTWPARGATSTSASSPARASRPATGS